MRRTSRIVVHYAPLIVIATFAITALMAAAIFVRGIAFNGSPQTLARNDDELRFYEQSRKTFGDDRVIIVALDTSDAFDPVFLRDLDRLTTKLASISGVEETQSLTTIKAVRGQRGDIRVERLIPPSMLNASASVTLQNMKREVTADPLYVHQLVSADGQTAAVNVFLKPLDEARTRAVAEEVERVARGESLPYRLLFAGVPIIESRGVKSMIRDFTVLSPIAAILCLAVFLFAFRTVWAATLSMAALIIGLIWTIGLMSLTGKPITLTTLAMPTVLMAVGSSYVFHVLNQYRLSISSAAKGDNQARKMVWLDGLDFIGPAVLVSGTTTMAGFGALASSTVPTVRDMGIFNAFGVFAMLVLSIAFLPAALALLPSDSLGSVDTKKDYATWLNNSLRNVTALILFRKRAVLLVTILATAALGLGAVWLIVNTDYMRIFARGSQTVRDAEEIHERLAGVASVQLVVSGSPAGEPHSDRPITTTPFLNGLAALEQFALQQRGVDSAISVADIVHRIKQVAGRGAEEAVASSAAPKPESRPDAETGEPFDPLSLIAEDESIYRLVSRDLSSAVIILRTDLSGSNELRALTDKIERWSVANLPPGMAVHPTGSTVLLNAASDEVANSQVWSLSIAVVAIYLMMVMLFRSFATGLLALIPNILPIVAFFGFMGWTGITLDITTSLIASAVLGLAVDNAVHMIRRYRQSVASEGTSSPEREGWAMWLTIHRTGKPMVLANLMLTAAFLIFVLSSFVPVRTGGVLWALTILACLAADLIFLPALMKTRIFARAALGKDLESYDHNPEPKLTSVAQ
jgi:uncharacterized protein